PEAEAEKPMASSADKAPNNTPATQDKAATKPAAQPGATPDTATAAALGKPAPDFTLTSLEGKTVRLSEHKGSVVVLEWFNPDCPFVRAAHEKGELKTMAQTTTGKGVVWLAINSGAPGKQGHGKDANTQGRERFGLNHPILMDETGKVGKRYGAKRTPHMFVIDKEGKLVYRGALDNTGSGVSADVDTVENYVQQAIDSAMEGKPVATPETKAYGCSVKYAG
ncbi:MAG: thioredoxin family protein, partial [Myxococcota bacterium]